MPNDDVYFDQVAADLDPRGGGWTFAPDDSAFAYRFTTQAAAEKCAAAWIADRPAAAAEQRQRRL